MLRAVSGSNVQQVVRGWESSSQLNTDLLVAELDETSVGAGLARHALLLRISCSPCLWIYCLSRLD